MPISIGTLIQRLPKDIEQRVNDAKKRFIQIIQGELRKESGLLLNRHTVKHRPDQTESISIPVTVSAGIPTQLRNLQFDDEYWHISPLLPYRSLLKNLSDSSTSMHNIISEIHTNPLSTLYETPAVDFEYVGDYASQLLEMLDHADPVRKILDIRDDVLGTYTFASSPNVYLTTPYIHLYWGVIGLVANMLSVSTEALTCVVLSHELAHGYTHKGSDIDGERWDTRAFQESERPLVEGIAQYYTHQICQRLESRMPDVFNAYDELLKYQPDDYRVHLNWVTDYSPEIVRTGIIEARRNRITEISVFESMLKDASNRLR